MENEINIMPEIEGLNKEKSEAPLQVSTEFLPVVYFKPSDFNDDSIKDNLIFMEFTKSDSSFSPKKAFVKRLDNSFLTTYDEDYYIPYLRVWPPINEGEERIFKLTCMVEATRNNCCKQGNIYIKIPEIEGLRIKNIEGNVLKNIRISETFTLELSVSANIDREKKDIDALPLTFYVMNDDNTSIDVGKVHLSIAPRDVFSKEDYNKFTQAYKKEIALNNPMWCIPAFRNSAQKILNFSMVHLGSEDKNTIHTHMVSKTTKGGLIVNGYANLFFESGFSKNSHSIDFTYRKVKYTNVKQYPLHLLSSAEIKCRGEMENELGYKIFAVSIVNGEHVMSLVIKANDFQQLSYDLSDQFEIREISEKNLDANLEAQTQHTFKYCYVRYSQSLSNVNLTLWKIQQKR